MLLSRLNKNNRFARNIHTVNFTDEKLEQNIRDVKELYIKYTNTTMHIAYLLTFSVLSGLEMH